VSSRRFQERLPPAQSDSPEATLSLVLERFCPGANKALNWKPAAKILVIHTKARGRAGCRTPTRLVAARIAHDHLVSPSMPENGLNSAVVVL